MKSLMKLSAVAVAGLLGLVACSETSTSPESQRSLSPLSVSFALLAQPTNFPDNPNTITVCSAGASATFSVTFANSLGLELVPPLIGAGNPYTLNLAANTCVTIWSKSDGLSPVDPLSSVTIVQTSVQAGYQFQMVEVASGDPGAVVSADNATMTANLSANAYHGSTATFTQRLIPVVHSGGSGTWQGGIFTLVGDVLSTTDVRFKNTSGSQKSISVINLAVTSVVANLGGGNQSNITGATTCTFSPDPSLGSPVNIAPDAYAQFSVSCDLPGVYKEVNITLRAEINNGSQQYYYRTYTVKGN